MKSIKTIALIIFTALSIVSCQGSNRKIMRTEKLYLRQMIQEDDKIKSGEAFFMFGFGSAGYSETEVEYVQVFAKMGSGYRMVKIPLDNVEVIITKNEMPSLQIRYWGHDGDNVDPNTVLYYEQYDYLQIPSFIINCPEELLPEKFSPINL